MKAVADGPARHAASHRPCCTQRDKLIKVFSCQRVRWNLSKFKVWEKVPGRMPIFPNALFWTPLKTLFCFFWKMSTWILKTDIDGGISSRRPLRGDKLSTVVFRHTYMNASLMAWFWGRLLTFYYEKYFNITYAQRFDSSPAVSWPFTNSWLSVSASCIRGDAQVE